MVSVRYDTEARLTQEHTMLIKKLPLRVPVNTNVRIKTQHFSSPQLLRVFHALDNLFQPRLGPQPFCKAGIFDLKAVVHSDCIALLWDSGCCGEGEGFQEGDIFRAESRGPETGDSEDLIG